MSRAFTMKAALVLLLAVSPGRATPQTQAFVTLQELRNLVRPLLIFAPTRDDPELMAQVQILNQNLRQTRNLYLLPVGVPYQSDPPTDAKFTLAEARSLRRRFQVAPADFTVILLDDQGSEIYRSPRPLSMQELTKMIKALAHHIIR